MSYVILTSRDEESGDVLVQPPCIIVEVNCLVPEVTGDEEEDEVVVRRRAAFMAFFND